jgi:hypothetical protein
MVQINPQVYALLQSHISDHVSFKARREVQEQFAQDQNLMQLMQTDPEQYQIAFDNAVATAAAEITEQLVVQEIQSKQGQVDPLVRLKQQEIDLRALDLQRKSEETQFKAEQQNMREADKLAFDYDRLAVQDRQSEERLDVAKQKLQKK